MKAITYTTEKRINSIKAIPFGEQTNYERLVIHIWDNVVGYMGMSLKNFEKLTGGKVDNAIEENVHFFEGIHGSEVKTQGNVRYVGANDLSYVSIKDFNAFVKQIEQEYK